MAGGGVRPGFTGATFDRADHLRLDGERVRELAANPEARLLRLSALDPVLDGAGSLGWSPLAELAEEAELIFLGLEREAPLFAPLQRIEAEPASRAVFALITTMAPEEAALWGTARSLIVWHNRHRFCANCGAATAVFRAGWGRKCGACVAEHFPRVYPVVIMLAEHEGRVLLGRQPQYPPVAIRRWRASWSPANRWRRRWRASSARRRESRSRASAMSQASPGRFPAR
jgi:NAD+ diphosphatase